MSSRQIVFLDDDHVVRVGRYALAGPAQVSTDWLTAYFSPEDVDPLSVRAIAQGLHDSDGVTVLPSPLSIPEVIAADPTVIIFRRGNITHELIQACPSLRLVQRLGERSDAIDLDAARKRGVHVSCVPRRVLIYTAEHAVLLMLALSKKLLVADAGLRTGAWDASRVVPIDAVAYNWLGTQGLSGLYGKTLGIIGMGEVGAILARIASGFGMRVLYNNRNRLSGQLEQENRAQWTDRASLLAQSDFVSVNAANTPENVGMINLQLLSAMKPSAFLINTSRGRLINEDDLFTALTTGVIAGAGLDVHAVEPRPAGDRFNQLDNVILTPHHAGGSRLGVLDELRLIFDNCREVIAGRAPVHARVV
jgi:phosphoglycerate dehydrogenase-like enzyme